MNRLAALVAGAALLCSTGCTHDAWSVSKAMGWDEPKTPAAKDLPPGQLETAARVESVGRKLLGHTTFAGVEPLFHTFGVKESFLFHRGTEELMISEGLVAQCKTDEQLAAVLSAELGQMIAEKRGARSVGRNVDPIPAVGDGGNPVAGGGTRYDSNREAELALHEKKFPRGARVDSGEATKVARELLESAGYDPGAMEKVQPLLKNSRRGDELRKQMGASAPAPKWER